MNCVVIAARRGGETSYAACMVAATTRADVNGLVRRHLGSRKASFGAMDVVTSLTGMEYGGITPIGLPAGWPVLVDASVVKLGSVVIGSGIRGSKLWLPGRLLADAAWRGGAARPGGVIRWPVWPGLTAGIGKGILGLVKLDTSFGEASSRTQATDPNRRETLRIRTPLPGLRGEAKWLRMRPAVCRYRRTRYAVECQSSYERGDSAAHGAAQDSTSQPVSCVLAHERRGRREARDGL